MKTPVSLVALAAIVAGTAVLASPLAAQQVYVVSPLPGPGVDFVSVQAAVNAASDGDVLLLTAGTLDTNVEIVDKSLVLAGVEDVGSYPPSIGNLMVRDLAATRSVLVRRLAIEHVIGPKCLDVVDCEGPVLFEDCLLTAGASTPGNTPQPSVVRSAHVMFTRCALNGAYAVGGFSTAPGGAGLIVDDSDVALYECTLQGGYGAGAFFYFDLITLPFPASAGGQGLQVWSGSVFLSGTEVRGGAGGAGYEQIVGSGCLQPQIGGAGIRTYSVVRSLDSIITGGAAGTAVECGTASDGTGVVLLPGGSLVEIPEAARSLEISSPLENGGTCSVAIQGAPGELVGLLQSLAPLGSWHGGLKGTLAGQPPYLTFLFGPLGPDGTLAFDVPLPANALPVGLPALTFIDQVVVAASSGGGLLSSPSQVVLVPDVP